MAGDQQFCLRWNNHQTTLTSIFGTLYDAEELFDCTLSAEGRCVRAHRILLSACSPYFQYILSQHADEKPIFILKDVKFKELQALMDYMYKGEVNVSQDELGELLKVAENLKIKGLSDSAEKTDERPVQQRLAAPPPPVPPPPVQHVPNVARSGLTIEHRRSNYQSNDLHTDHPSTSAESPGPRKRKRVRRRSSDDESGSGMSQTPIEPLNSSYNDASSPIVQPMPRLQVTSTASSKTTAVIPQTTLDRPLIPEPTPHPVIVPKTEPPIEQVLVPKQEVDDMADESADYEDLTLDDDMLDDSQPGPSHGSEGSSSQGFPPWQMSADGTMDEDMMRAQEAAGGTRDAQGSVQQVATLDALLTSLPRNLPQVFVRLKRCDEWVLKTIPDKALPNSPSDNHEDENTYVSDGSDCDYQCSGEYETDDDFQRTSSDEQSNGDDEDDEELATYEDDICSVKTEKFYSKNRTEIVNGSSKLRSCAVDSSTGSMVDCKKIIITAKQEPLLYKHDVDVFCARTAGLNPLIVTWLNPTTAHMLNPGGLNQMKSPKAETSTGAVVVKAEPFLALLDHTSRSTQ